VLRCGYRRNAQFPVGLGKIKLIAEDIGDAVRHALPKLREAVEAQAVGSARLDGEP
jgi:hypothetical protein